MDVEMPCMDDKMCYSSLIHKKVHLNNYRNVIKHDMTLYTIFNIDI